jgi:hypothetical protein
MRAYDCHQREAYTVRCIRCLKWWQMTKVAKFVCGMCRVPSVSAALHRQDLRVVPNEVRS